MMEQIAATVAYALLVTGLLVRKKRNLHVTFMASGLAIDFALVVILQIQRNVIKEAVTEQYSLLERGHIIASTLAFGLYFPVIVLGLRQLLGYGSPTDRLWHIRIALTAFVLRSVGFLLMFTIE